MARQAGHGRGRQGATAIAYQPAGPDVPRELEAFMAMARGSIRSHAVERLRQRLPRIAFFAEQLG